MPPPGTLLPLLLLALQPARAFNLDVAEPALFRGAPGSLFGFAVDFYLPEPQRWGGWQAADRLSPSPGASR
ncbi:unnamed protein product [Caretta caretta]